MEASGALEGRVVTMPMRWTLAAVALAAAVIVACGDGADEGTSGKSEATATPAFVAAVSTPTPMPTPTSMPQTDSGIDLNAAADSGVDIHAAADSGVDIHAAADSHPVTDKEGQKLPMTLTFGWKTDFTKHSVPYSEITRGGPPRDGIPPIDNPKFQTVSDAPDYFVDHEPVVSFEFNGEAKAYPIAILMWHEIVNDEVGGLPITVTFCPLCNTAIVFDRRVGDRVFDFGTSGNVRNSDLVMWDRQTESWWQQITGEAISAR